MHLAGIASLPICPPTNSSSDNIGYRWRYTIPDGGYVFSAVKYSQDEVCLLHNRHFIILQEFFKNRTRGRMTFRIVSTNCDILQIQYGKQKQALLYFLILLHLFLASSRRNLSYAAIKQHCNYH